MTSQARELYPWERHCGCPTCKARPRQPCTTLRSRYHQSGMYGRPTQAHKARYQLWAYLWGTKPYK